MRQVSQMRSLKRVFGGLVLLLLAVQVHGYESEPGQFVVRLRKGSQGIRTSVLEKKLNGKVIDHVRKDVVLIQRSIGEVSAKVIQEIKMSDVVDIVEPNYIYKAIRTPNDADYGSLWGLSNSGQLDKKGVTGLRGADIGAEKAWDIETGSKDVVVAVIDTGVDFSIPDLVDNAWINEAEAKGKPFVDDDNNGYIDDINGFDFVADFGEQVDDNGHGSHCAGTIGARGDDGLGVVGVSWNVSLMAVKFLNSQGSGNLANAVKGLDYAVKNGAKILSNSWGGGGPSEIIKQAIEEAKEAGVLVIFAAGNNYTDSDIRPSYPASFQIDNIISVAAVNNRGELANFSNYGANSVHLAAPGVDIYSTVPGGFDVYSGTSMAAPHVTGIAALLLAQDSTRTYTDLRERILASARPLIGLQGKVKTGGIADAYYALTGIEPPLDPNDPTGWPEKEELLLSSPHPYASEYEGTHTVRKAGAKRMAVRFARFETEARYDWVRFYDESGALVGERSGNHDESFSPVVEGEVMVIKFKTDRTNNNYGFDIDQLLIDR